MAKIAASRIAMEEQAQANEELRKTKKELRKRVQQRDRRSTREQTLNLSARDTPKPFSQEIMDEAYDWCLVGFAGDQVEVRRYVELRTSSLMKMRP